jgi:hypothetical protein
MLRSQLNISSTLAGHALSWSMDRVVSHFGHVRSGVVSVGLDMQKRQEHAGRWKATLIPTRREGTFISHVLVLFMRKEHLACKERTIHPQGKTALSFAPSFSRYRSFPLDGLFCPSLLFPSHLPSLCIEISISLALICTASAVFDVYKMIVLVMLYTNNIIYYRLRQNL